LCGIIRHLGSEISRNGNKHALPLFKIARVLVRVDHGQKAARFSESCGFLLADIPAA
jgi:hypothetical protein